MTERERDLLNENVQLRLTIQGAMWVLRFVAEHSSDTACRLMARQVVDAHNPGTYPEAGAVNVSDFMSPVADVSSADVSSNESSRSTAAARTAGSTREVCPC